MNELKKKENACKVGISKWNQLRAKCYAFCCKSHRWIYERRNSIWYKYIYIYIYIKHEIEYMKNRTFVGVFVKYVKKQSLYLGDFYPWIS